MDNPTFGAEYLEAVEDRLFGAYAVQDRKFCLDNGLCWDPGRGWYWF